MSQRVSSTGALTPSCRRRIQTWSSCKSGHPGLTVRTRVDRASRPCSGTASEYGNQYGHAGVVMVRIVRPKKKLNDSEVQGGFRKLPPAARANTGIVHCTALTAVHTDCSAHCTGKELHGSKLSRAATIESTLERSLQSSALNHHGCSSADPAALGAPLGWPLRRLRPFWPLPRHFLPQWL